MGKWEALWTTPDWRRAGDYPNPETASADRWAWEFVRRNEEFCAGFIEAMRAPPLEGTFAIDIFCAKWGLHRALQHWVESGHIDAPVYLPRAIGFSDPAALTLRDHNVVLFPFDLSKPIEPQVAHARRYLKANQGLWESNRRDRPTTRINHAWRMFSFYLRAFDARQAKPQATFETIATCLGRELPDALGADTARKWVAAAERYIGGDYRLMGFAEPPKPES